jgi:hypothetical protein
LPCSRGTGLLRCGAQKDRSGGGKAAIFSDDASHVAYRLGNTPIRPYSFPHIFVEDVFPTALFERLRAHLPATERYVPISEGGLVSTEQGTNTEIYPERFILHFRPDHFERIEPADREVWTGFAEWLLGADFLRFVLAKFEGMLRQRFGEHLGSLRFFSSAQLLRDFTNYSLGPHSDAPDKVVVLLFYMPETSETEHLGTSIYVPHDPSAHDDTGRHFAREAFSLAATMPYRPNCATGFFKTPNSFHGVERVAGPAERRDLIQFAIRYTTDAGQSNS